MKTLEPAPTTPDAGLLTDAGGVEFSTEGLGLQPGVYSIGDTVRERHASVMDWLKSNESLLIGRASDSADVRQS